MGMANRMKELTQNILSSSEERAEALTKIKEETNTLRKEAVDMVQDFHDSRRKSGGQLRKELAEGRKILVQSGKQLRKDLAQDEKKRQQEVGKMLEAFQSSRQESGAEFRKELAEGKAKRKADVEGMLQGFRKARKEVQAALKGASDAWKEMGSAMRKKTSGGKAAPEVQAEMPVEIPPNREEKLLSIVNQHAEGITLSEVAKELGIVTIVLGRAAKVLLEKGKVRKEEKIYFPVTT